MLTESLSEVSNPPELDFKDDSYANGSKVDLATKEDEPSSISSWITHSFGYLTETVSFSIDSIETFKSSYYLLILLDLSF
jgi:hypothetical protein